MVEKTVKSDIPAGLAPLLVGERCSACTHYKESTVAVTEGAHAGEFVCQDCLNVLIKAARMGIDDGKKMAEAQARVLGSAPTGRGRRRH